MILSHRWTKPALLLGALVAIGGTLAAWKNASIESANAAATGQWSTNGAWPLKVVASKGRGRAASASPGSGAG